jgi:hypothetical protein
MFVATARDGTGLVKPKDWKARVPGVEEHGVFWNRMIQNTIAATPGGASHCVMAVLWFQGERDAGLGVAGQDYQDGLEDFADSLPIEWGCTVPVVAARIGPVAGVPEEQIQAIRDAQTDAIAAHPDILAGPVTEDLPVKLDGVHFGDPAADALLERWCAAIQPLYAASLDCAP